MDAYSKHIYFLNDPVFWGKGSGVFISLWLPEVPMGSVYFIARAVPVKEIMLDLAKALKKQAPKKP
jgi:hypothetical protein